MNQDQLIRKLEEQVKNARAQMNLVTHARSWIDQGTYAKGVLLAQQTALETLIQILVLATESEKIAHVG